MLIDALYAGRTSPVHRDAGEVRGRPHRCDQRGPAHPRRRGLRRRWPRRPDAGSRRAAATCARQPRPRRYRSWLSGQPAGPGHPARRHRRDGGRFLRDVVRDRGGGRRVLRRGRSSAGGHRQALVLPRHLHRLRDRAEVWDRFAARGKNTNIRYGLGTVARRHQRGHARDHPPARAARYVPRQHLRVARSGDPGAGRNAQAARGPRRVRGGRRRRGRDAILRVDDIHLNFGGVKAIIGVGFEVNRGEISSIIGPNGAGKSSMLNVISGFYRPSRGRIYFEGKDRTHLRGARRGAAGLRAHVPEHRAVQGHDARSTTS